MDSNTLLDALKKRLNLPSDYALSLHFRVTPRSLKEMRQRGLSDERALQVATLLDLDAGQVLAAIHAERAKDADVKKAWEKVAKALRSAAAVVPVFFLVGALGGTTPNAQGAPQSTNVGSMYIMSSRRRALILAALRRFFGIGFACPSPI